jgi:hypothetical protein
MVIKRSMWQIAEIEWIEGERYMIILRAPGTKSFLRASTTGKDELEAYQKALVLFPLRKEEEP